MEKKPPILSECDNAPFPDIRNRNTKVFVPQSKRHHHSSPMRAPFSATERFINKTTGTSASINMAKIQKQSK